MSQPAIAYRAALFVYLCIFGMAHHSFAQADSAQQPGGSFKMRVDVDLVTIEVSALGRDGKAARDLKKEDFRLYEDGKKQEIVSFDQVTAGSATSPKDMSLLDESGRKRGKTVLMVFMESAVSPQNLNLVRDSIAKFVNLHMRPQDLFAVLSFGSSMRIIQNLTGEREDVLAAVRRLASSAVVSFSFDDLLRSLEQVNYSIARIKGQKSVLILGPTGIGYAPLDHTRYNKAVNSARQSNVVFYAADPQRILGGGGFAGSVVSTPLPGVMTQGSRGNVSGGLVPLTAKTLAADTGGFSIDNVLDFDSELEKLDQQISNYYVLGFQSSNPKHDGTFRKVEVKTEVNGVRLKHRDGYVDRSPIDVLASSKQEKALLTALASPGSATQVPISLRPLYFYDSPRTARVLIASKIQMGKIAFRKKAGQMSANLNVMGVAYSENGSIAARFSETMPVTFDNEKEAEFRKGSLAYRNYFKLRPGKYRLKFAVSDESNNIGSIEQAMEVPPLPEQGIAVSSIALAEQTSQLPDLIQRLQSQMLDQNDPLIYSGVQIEPGVDHRLAVNSVIRVLFRIYNLPANPDDWALVAKAKLVNEKGEELALPPISLKKAIIPAGAGEAAVGLSLPFKGAVAGTYKLSLEVIDAKSSQSASIQTDLEFTN